MSALYAQIILPLQLKDLTYLVPNELAAQILIGQRVEVPLGKKRVYSGIVLSLHHDTPELFKPRSIIAIIDELPIVSDIQLKQWQWMAEYYVCTIGDVMQAALPIGLKPDSTMMVHYNEMYDGDFSELSEDEFTVAEALSNAKEMPYETVFEILKSKYPDKKEIDLFNKISTKQNNTYTEAKAYLLIEKLIELNVVHVDEQLIEKYKPKFQTALQLHHDYVGNDVAIKNLLDELEKKAPRQVDALVTFLMLSKSEGKLTKTALVQKTGVTEAAVKALIDKNILQTIKIPFSRIFKDNFDSNSKFELNAEQQTALTEIESGFENGKTVLLHGVTGSGKTMIYLECIKKEIEAGNQVLYLLPEIGLTENIINRIQKFFGEQVGVYHSKYNSAQRVETWKAVIQQKYKVVIGARSAVFLPFQKLGLIIVDEEHDASLKQFDAAPYYHARDTAIVLAKQQGAKVLLGSATPSIESYYNAIKNKYALVTLQNRYNDASLPEIIIADVRDQQKMKLMKASFTTELYGAIQEALAKDEQVILFQNRRGFAPSLFCGMCGWVPDCPNCTVKLTYHKFSETLHCHYCGFNRKLINACPNCNATTIKTQGIGTQKIEEELKLFFPKARIARMDMDTITNKDSHNKILAQFDHHEIDILVGTQMIAKGLDFEKVNLVGVMSTDNILNFPDFRVVERGFQLLTQISGRSGRKSNTGKVILQALNTKHPVLEYVLHHQQEEFYNSELHYRKMFNYPPFCRLIQITIKHKNVDKVAVAAQALVTALETQLQKRILGPTKPAIDRIKNLYLRDIMIKLEPNAEINHNAKIFIKEQIQILKEIKGFGQLQIAVDVDVQ